MRYARPVACASTGVTSCVGGAVLDSCTPGSGAADDTTCDGIDDDCDGSIDECRTYYLDADGDSYGTNDVTMEAPSTPAGYDKDGGDCNDADPAINPRAAEVCGDGIDNNCNGEMDEGCEPEPASPEV